MRRFASRTALTISASGIFGVMTSARVFRGVVASPPCRRKMDEIPATATTAAIAIATLWFFRMPQINSSVVPCIWHLTTVNRRLTVLET